VKILNFGSLNIDHVYQVAHFVRPGETLASHAYAKHVGGKGLNQSLALARAGAQVYHAGCIGEDGLFLKQLLDQDGADTRYVRTVKGASGHAMIQVNEQGENCIILHGGANQRVTTHMMYDVLESFGTADLLLLQNEVNDIAQIMNLAKQRGMHIVFNPAPMNAAVKEYPLELVDYFILNEIEAAELAGLSVQEAGELGAEQTIGKLTALFPRAKIVMTLGKQGVCFACGDEVFLKVEAKKVSAVDTTAAGDTFTGYFMAGLVKGKDMETCLRQGCEASAVCVTKEGAADSIPYLEDI
jgi:ribokinase